MFSVGSLVFCCLFFFKQKTAYEMRISDWSSDVCSSDLMSDETDGSSDADVEPDTTEASERKPVEPRTVDAKEFEEFIWAYAEEIEGGEGPIGSAEVLRLRYWILLLLFKARCNDLPKGLDC